VGIWWKNFLELGFGLAGFCSNATVLFYSGHIWRYWFKTNPHLNKSKEKAAAENTPVNVVRDRIIAVLIFSVFTVLLGFV
jgi:POT family proton-dependent oligopeptide transporter